MTANLKRRARDPIQVGQDPAYADGSGTNVVRYEVALPVGQGPNLANLTVKATLYYQSIPPYYLNDRFKQAPDQPATQRLYYLTSNLQTRGTAIENWKFAIASSSQPVTVRWVAPLRKGPVMIVSSSILRLSK